MARSPLAPLLLLPLAFAAAACTERRAGNASADMAGNAAGAVVAGNAAAADSAFAPEKPAGTGKAAAAGTGGTAKAAAATGGQAAKAGAGGSPGKAKAAGETLLGSKTVKARFDGFLGGHGMDAKLSGPGYGGPKRVAVQSAPVAAFLHARRGQTLELKLDTVRQPDWAEPESGPPRTVVRIASARAGAANSDSYWRTLPAEEKECATRSLDGIGTPCNGDEAVRKQGERG